MQVQAEVECTMWISLLLHSIPDGKLGVYNFRIAASILVLRSLEGLRPASVLRSLSPWCPSKCAPQSSVWVICRAEMMSCDHVWSQQDSETFLSVRPWGKLYHIPVWSNRNSSSVPHYSPQTRVYTVQPAQLRFGTYCTAALPCRR